MTDPALAIATPYGRLYRHPSTPPEAVVNVEEALEAGLLMPSITNVIDVTDKPHLNGWYGRKAADAALEVTKTHADAVRRRPWSAKKWISEAATRSMEESARVGDLVHCTAEALALGQEIDINEEITAFIDSWRSFVHDWSPEFKHLEATCFGAVNDPLAGALLYAGTADVILGLGDRLFAGDYKSGRSVHTAAALQLAALANATELALPDGTTIPMPHIDGGVVIHLTRDGYAVHEVPLADGLAFSLFARLRGIWDFQMTELASRKPLLMTRPLSSPEVLGQVERTAPGFTAGALRTA